MRFLPVLALIALMLVSPELTSSAGLVPCSGTDCNSCSVVSLANNLLKWLIGVLFVIFAIMVAASGFGLVTSGGNEAAKTAAKSRIFNAIIGIILVLAAWLLVDTVMRGMLTGGAGKIEGKFWYTIECDQQSATEDVPSPQIKMPTDAAGAPVSNCSNSADLIAKFNGSPVGVNDPLLGKDQSSPPTTLIGCYLADPAILSLTDTSKLFTHDLSHPECANTNGIPVCGPCSHGAKSCHYGRGSGKGAQAVDFNSKSNTYADEKALYDLIKIRHASCGGTLGFEDNHTHISLGTCGS